MARVVVHELLGGASLLTAMTSLDPAARPPAAQVLSALRAFNASTPALPGTTQSLAPPPSTRVMPTAPASQPRRVNRRWLLVAIGLAAALIIVLLATRPWTSPHPAAGPTVPASRSSSSGPATHPASTSPITSPPVTTPAQAIAALRSAISGAVNAGNLDSAGRRRPQQPPGRPDPISHTNHQTGQGQQATGQRRRTPGRRPHHPPRRPRPERPTHLRRTATTGSAARRTRTPRATTAVSRLLTCGAQEPQPCRC